MTAPPYKMYLSAKRCATTKTKTNDGQHPKEQGVFLVDWQKEVGQTTLFHPTAMLHVTSKRPTTFYRAKPDEDPSVTTIKRNQPLE